MSDENDGPRRSDYRAARIGAASLLTFVVGALLIVDSINPAYEVQPTTLGLLATMILVLLGIEGTSILRGK